MIYKIQSDFKEEFDKKISKISEFFNFIYTNNILYIALRDYKNLEKDENFLKKILKPNKNFLIKKIDENNLSQESQIIVDWCKDNFIRLDSQRFEIEQQDKLKTIMLALDNFEKIMQDKVKET